MTEHGQANIEIQSFHLVFALERRLHRIDRWRLPVPGGIPITAIGYTAAGLALVIALRQTPGLGALVAALPAPVAYVLLPAAAAMAMTRIKVDGRPAHRHLTAQTLAPITARTRAAGRTTRAKHTVDDTGLYACGPTDPEYRAATITGPAKATLTRPAHAKPAGRTLHLTAAPGAPLARARTLTLHQGQQVRIKERR